MNNLFSTLNLVNRIPDVVDIGRWQPYNDWTSDEQISLQKEFLFNTGISNGITDVCFILTKNIYAAEKWLEEISSSIKLSDTEVTLEDEVFYTTKIEGAKTTRIRTTEIHNGSTIDHSNYKSERMVLNSFKATKLLTLHGGKVTKDILIDVWKVLIEDVSENESIRGERFRTGDVSVGVFEPTSYDNLESLMQSYCDFYNSIFLDNYPFIKAVLLHYIFETVHPFCDGNGRLGRLLMNNYLISRNIESAKSVSFSMTIDRLRSHYDVAFIDSENEFGDCTPFIEYMIQVFKMSYESVM